jgi:hypothetical protein
MKATNITFRGSFRTPYFNHRQAAVQHLIRMMHYDILRSQRHRWSTEPMGILPSGYVKIAIEHGHL